MALGRNGERSGFPPPVILRLSSEIPPKFIYAISRMARVSSGSTFASLSNGKQAMGPLDLYRFKNLSMAGDDESDAESIMRMTTSGDRRPCAVLRESSVFGTESSESDKFAKAARLCGAVGEEDINDFTDVTVLDRFDRRRGLTDTGR